MTGVLGALGGMFPVATVTVSLGSVTVSDTESTTTAIATYAINSNGTVRDHDGISLGTWLLVGLASAYEVRATLSSGSTPSGTLNTWLSCSTTRTWGVSDSSTLSGAVSCVLTVEIRDAATLAVQATATITLTAEKTGGA